MYDINALNEIAAAIIKTNESVAVAESVTSGHIQAALSSAVNASKFYQGGITAYNLGQKTRHLNIDPVKAESCDCVSQEIAIAMATEVCRLFTSDWGIGITGYATLLPEQNVEQPFAFYAIVHKGKPIVSQKIFSSEAGTAQVQLFFVDTIIKALHDSTVHAGETEQAAKPALQLQ